MEGRGYVGSHRLDEKATALPGDRAGGPRHDSRQRVERIHTPIFTRQMSPVRRLGDDWVTGGKLIDIIRFAESCGAAEESFDFGKYVEADRANVGGSSQSRCWAWCSTIDLATPTQAALGRDRLRWSSSPIAFPPHEPGSAAPGNEWRAPPIHENGNEKSENGHAPQNGVTNNQPRRGDRPLSWGNGIGVRGAGMTQKCNNPKIDAITPVVT